MPDRPTWKIVLEAAERLTTIGASPFSLDTLIREVQALDPTRDRPSIAPIVQA
jgi:hypothetical protein